MKHLSKKQLIRHNQAKIKSYVRTILIPDLLKKVEEVVNDDKIPYDWRYSDSTKIKNMVLHEVLKSKSEIYKK